MTDLDALLAARVEMSDTKLPLPPDLRSTWRIPVLLVCLEAFHGKRASLKHLHLVNGAVRVPALRNELASVLSPPTDAAVGSFRIRFEPSLVRAANMAIGLGLVTRTDGGDFQLTGYGVSLAGEFSRAGLFSEERQFLASLGRLTKTRLEQVLP